MSLPNTNGNTVADGHHTYQYDARDRLASVDNSQAGIYRYNAFGQRVYKWGLAKISATPDLNRDGQVTEADLHVLQAYIKNGKAPLGADLNGDGRVDGKDTARIATRIGADKSQGNVKEKSVKDGKTQSRHACLSPAVVQERLFVNEEWRLLGEYSLAGTPVQETVWLGDAPIATVQNGATYYISADHLGTPRVMTSDSGTVVWRWDSEPYGTGPAKKDVDGDGVAVSYGLRLPGQYFDAETGLHYNYF